MGDDALIMFLAVASILAGAAGLVFFAGWFSPSLGSTIRRNLAGSERWIAFFCSGSAMLGSLYMSEVAEFIPCQNCWYQRIAMYPIAVITLIAAIRKDDSVWYYVAGLAIPGMLVSTYHIALQNTDIFGDGSCSAEASCTVKWVDHFGFVSIPVMAMGCFIFLLGLSGLAIRAGRSGEQS